MKRKEDESLDNSRIKIRWSYLGKLKEDPLRGIEYSPVDARVQRIRLNIDGVGRRDKVQSRGYVSYGVESETYCSSYINVIET